MKIINENLINQLSGVKYNDFTGLAAIDNDDLAAVYELCRKHIVDFDSFGFFAIQFTNTMERVIRSNKVRITVYLIDKDKYDLSIHHDEVDVIEKSFTISYKELAESIKRYNIVLTSYKLEDDLSADSINIINERDY